MDWWVDGDRWINVAGYVEVMTCPKYIKLHLLVKINRFKATNVLV